MKYDIYQPTELALLLTHFNLLVNQAGLMPYITYVMMIFLDDMTFYFRPAGDVLMLIMKQLAFACVTVPYGAAWSIMPSLLKRRRL